MPQNNEKHATSFFIKRDIIANTQSKRVVIVLCYIVVDKNINAQLIMIIKQYNFYRGSIKSQ